MSGENKILDYAFNLVIITLAFGGLMRFIYVPAVSLSIVATFFCVVAIVSKKEYFFVMFNPLMIFGDEILFVFVCVVLIFISFVQSNEMKISFRRSVLTLGCAVVWTAICVCFPPAWLTIFLATAAFIVKIVLLVRQLRLVRHNAC